MFNFLSAAGSSASDIIVIVFSVLLTLGCIIALIFLLCRFSGDGESIGKVENLLVKMMIAVFAGFALRLMFALFIRGYRGDYELFVAMFDCLKLKGFDGYYNGNASGVLYPIVYFAYLPFAGISNASGLSEYGMGMQFMIKLPLIIADLFAAFAIYKIADKYFNQKIAFVLFVFVCVCPVFYIGSCVWCTPITFTAMFICFAWYFLARKNYIGTIAFATAAAFSSKEGIYLFPVVAVFSVYHFVKAIVNIRRDNVGGKAVLNADYRAAVMVPIGFVASAICSYLIGLLVISSYNSNFFMYFYEFLIAPLGSWRYFTLDGLSVYSIFGRNGSEPGARFPSWLFVCLFLAILVSVVCVVYFTKRNRATMVMLGAFSLYTMQMYFPGSTAIGMQSALLALAAAYALVKDKRILTIMFIAGIAYTVNALAVMSGAGYLNNLGDYNISATAGAGGARVINILCSVVALLAHIYFTIIAVNIGMTGQKRMLAQTDGLSASIKEYLSVKKD